MGAIFKKKAAILETRRLKFHNWGLYKYYLWYLVLFFVVAIFINHIIKINTHGMLDPAFLGLHVQHYAYFLIQLNADFLYPFACWSLCLLCLLILMLIILKLILIESRSMLIVYWLGDRKLINAYLTKNSIQNIYLPTEFLKI